MKEIRRAFHEIANKLNIITVKTGTTLELLKIKDVDSMKEVELKAEYNKLLGILSISENSALEAGELVEKLKVKIYDLLKIDISEPLD